MLTLGLGEQGLLWGRRILAGPGCKSPRESGVVKGAEIGELRPGRGLWGLGVLSDPHGEQRGGLVPGQP